jgi:glycosyltransferase involved in cell wall biosynthesis
VGGAEQQLVTLAKGLRAAGHDAEVAVFYGGGVLERDLAEAGIPVHDLEKRGRWDALFVSRLVALVRRRRPDVLHSYLMTSNKLAALLRPWLGQTRVVWGIRSAFMDLSRYDWLTRWSFRAEPVLSRLSHAIITNSEAARRYASATGFSAEKIVVVPNGIDCRRFAPDPAARARWRARWGVGEDVLVVGLVGRIDPMKDHPTFLKAAARVSSAFPAAAFVCAGDGTEGALRDARALAERLGIGPRVRWEPASREVEGIYNGLDLLALSSYGESFPNVVAEAMACGRPCVVTDVGDAAQIVGTTGLVVPPRRPEALGDAMSALLGEGKVALATRGVAARDRITAQYSIESLVARTVEVLGGAPSRTASMPGIKVSA